MSGLDEGPGGFGRGVRARLAHVRARPFGGPAGASATPDTPIEAPALDLRLLVPALDAWGACALTLAVPVALRASLAAVALMAGLAMVLATGRRPGVKPSRGLATFAGRFTGAVRGPGSRGRPAPVDGAVPSWVGLGAMTLVVTGLCLLASAAHGAVRDASPLARLAGDHAVATLRGTVVAEPIRVAAGGPGQPVVLVRLRVSEVQGRGVRAEAAAQVLVRGDESWIGLTWHQGLTVTARLSVADPADPEVAVARPLGPARDLTPPGAVGRAADHVRHALAEAADRLPADARGLLPGLVVGDTSRTPPDLTEAMRTTGMTHLTAVSGSNVAVVLALVLVGCRRIGLPVRVRPMVGLVAVAGFVVLARPEPSVLRAAVMGSVGLVGVFVARHRSGLPVLSAAVIGLLCVDPWLARSFGFALSTLATLGLLVFVRSWGAAIDRRLPERLGGLGQVVAIPVAAQLMCAPVVVLLQGSVSIVGVAANLLAAPFVAPATVCGVATALLAVVWPAAAVVPVWLAGAPTLAIAWVARLAADVPGGTLPWPDGPPGAVLLAAVSVLILLTGPWLTAAARRRPLVAVVLALVMVGASIPTRLATWPPDGWVLVACDVGQGDGLVLRSGPSAAVVVDTGPDPALMDGCLDRLGIRHLDAVVLTHFHADHVDGLAGALDGRTVDQILVSPVRDPDFQAREVDRLAKARGIPVVAVWAGDDLVLGSVRAHVWWPARRIEAGSVPNNASIVLTVADLDLTALMLGDVEREAGHQVLLGLRRAPLMTEGPGMAAGADGVFRFDVVKVAHHGSSNVDPALLGAVRAPVALVSVGRDNDYGHPAPSTMATLRAQGYAVWRTDQHGTVGITRTAAGERVISTR